MIKYETNSKNIKKGQIFVCIKGNTVDGHDYIEEAIKNGASKIISEKEISASVPLIVVEDTKEYLSNKLKEEYSSDFDNLHILGITGTNGKTTSAYLTYQLLLSLGINATYIGTLGFINPNKEITLQNTTPDILTLYNLLEESKSLGSTHIIMEVSSHALSLNRLNGIKLEGAAFTNLTQDHLDYHKTMENYLKDKLKIIDLLKPNAPLIVNLDDTYAVDFIKKYKNIKTIGKLGDYKIISYKITPSNIILIFSYNNKTYNVKLPLTSKFNIYNYLTSLSLLVERGFDIKELLKNSQNLKAPEGRCETLEVNKGYAVIDYAHTPDAVSKIISSYNELKENKVITIIGCGGDRDKTKRPIMGRIATELSDYVILTSDNPRTENPEEILEDIIKGIYKQNYEVQVNREDAIKRGLDLMEEKDILLVLGKGHENYQIIGKTKYHFSDKEEILKYQKTLNKHLKL